MRNIQKPYPLEGEYYGIICSEGKQVSLVQLDCATDSEAMIQAEILLSKVRNLEQIIKFPKLSYAHALRLLNENLGVEEEDFFTEGLMQLSKLFQQPFFICDIPDTTQFNLLLVLEDATPLFISYTTVRKNQNI